MGKKSVNNGHHFDADRYAATVEAILTQNAQKSVPFEFTTESGKLFLIEKIGMESVLELGLFDKLDFFTKQLAADDKSKPAEPATQDSFAMQVFKNFGSMKETIHKVLSVGVIAPVLQPVPGDPTASRKDGVLYVDTVPFEDAMELFGEILDTEGLSSFRQESQASVGDVPADESVPSPTE